MLSQEHTRSNGSAPPSVGDSSIPCRHLRLPDGRLVFGHHLDDLRKSGLTDETIVASGIYSEDRDHSLAAILGWERWSRKKRGSALVIPFRSPTGEPLEYRRVKPDSPRVSPTGRKIKYESPKGQPNRPYFPPGTIAALADPAVPLLVTEGEKKALKADQEGFPTVGLVGVLGFVAKGSTRLPAELEAVAWSGRSVTIAFDSDGADNPNVRAAESWLASVLTARGAVVKVLRFPAGPNGEKVGLDDILVSHGRDGLYGLLATAEDPEPVDPSAEKIDAGKLDALVTARQLLDAHGKVDGELRLHYHREEFWHWTGRRYRVLQEDDLRAKVVVYLDAYVSRITKAVVSNVIEMLKAETLVPSHRDAPCWLGPHEGPQPHRIALRNGILDLDKALAGKPDALGPHSPLWFSPVCLPYDYDPTAEAPHWLNVVTYNLSEDPERIAIAQEWFGLCLSHSTDQQKFLLMYGEGGTGKSVCCAGLTALLGRENCSAVPLEAFGGRFDLNQTLGKLANISAEIGELDKAAEGVLKGFTSGDLMRFERKYKDPIEALPTARLVLATNNLPRFADKSGGLWRRMILLPFDRVIPEDRRIRGLDKASWWVEQGECPGMLNWALDGLRRLRRQGRFTTSAVCEAALAKYREESNPARQWLLENYHEVPDAPVLTHELHAVYTAWAKASGYHTLALNTFAKEVGRTFPTAVPKRLPDLDGKRRQGFVGIAEGSAW